MSEYFTQTYAQRQAALEQAKTAFFRSGGQILTIDHAAPSPQPSVTDAHEVVAILRAHRHLGVIAAAKAAHLSTRTVNKIAKRNAIEFETYTAEKQAERHRTMAPVIRRLVVQGASQNQMAAQLGISRTSLQTIARSEDINLPTRGSE